MKTSVIIDLAGNLQNKARQYSQALTGLSDSGSRSLSLLNRSAQMAGKGLDALGNKYTAILTGAGLGATIKSVGTLQERMTRLGIAADVSDSKIKELQASIFETAQASDIRVNPDQLLSALESILEKTGDLEFAEKNLRAMALAIQATGAEGSAIGDIFAEFQKQGMGDAEIFSTIDTLIKQGKAGAFTLKDLASLGPRVVTAYTALGRTGPEAMKEMGAVLQLIRMGTGSSEQAATAWEALLRSFSDKTKVGKLEAIGVTVFEDDGSTVRAANNLMVDILKSVDNNALNLSEIFDAEALRTFNAMLGEIKRTGNADIIKQLMAIDGNGSALLDDSARAANTATSAITNLNTAWQQFTNNNLAEPIQNLADALNSISPEKLQSYLDIAKNITLGLGGLVVAKKSYNAFQGIKGIFSKNALGSPAHALGSLAMPSPLPVFVTNSANIANGINRRTSIRRNGGILSSSKRGLNTPSLIKPTQTTLKPMQNSWSMGKVGGGLNAAMGIVNVGSVLLDSSLSSEEKVQGTSIATGSALGAAGGAWAGAAAGAALGSIIPVIGTTIGGILGMLTGSWFGSEKGASLGEQVGELLNRANNAEEIGRTFRENQDTFAEKYASYSQVEIVVKGSAEEVKIVKNPDYHNLDVLSQGLQDMGIMMMD